jgi:hypothetical protein
MRREISSVATPFYKAVFLLAIGIYAIISTFSLIEELKKFREMTQFQILAYIFGIPLTIFIAFLLIRLALSWKKIEIEDDGLIVTEANFLVKKTSTFVPFENIERAHQNFFLRANPGTVTIEFIEPTFFGKKVKFVSKYRMFTYTTHPVVEEINCLANKSNRFIT